MGLAGPLLTLVGPAAAQESLLASKGVIPCPRSLFSRYAHGGLSWERGAGKGPVSTRCGCQSAQGSPWMRHLFSSLDEGSGSRHFARCWTMGSTWFPGFVHSVKEKNFWTVQFLLLLKDVSKSLRGCSSLYSRAFHGKTRL